MQRSWRSKIFLEPPQGPPKGWSGCLLPCFRWDVASRRCFPTGLCCVTHSVIVRVFRIPYCYRLFPTGLGTQTSERGPTPLWSRVWVVQGPWIGQTLVSGSRSSRCRLVASRPSRLHRPADSPVLRCVRYCRESKVLWNALDCLFTLRLWTHRSSNLLPVNYLRRR